MSDPTAGQRTWIFQANPKYYDIDSALKNLPEMSWSVKQYADVIKPGDTVFIWKAGPEGGIVADASVLTEPKLMEQEGIEYAVDPKQFANPARSVRIRFGARYNPPISRYTLRAALPALSIVEHPQGTNFKVDAEEAIKIRELIAMSGGNGDESSEERPLPAPLENKTWACAPGPRAEYWEEFYRDGIIAIGWDALGDLRQYSTHTAIAQKLAEVNKLKGIPVNDARACFDFLHTMKEGDRIFAKRGRDEVVGYGTVIGPYEYRANRTSYRNVRSVRWECRGNWKSKPVFAPKTLTDFTPYPETVAELTKLIGAPQQSPRSSLLAPLPPYTVKDALQDVAFDAQEFERILSRWRAKKNVILQGPPGVGKTFLAKRLAYCLLGQAQPARVGMIQFHQSYSYEDFIQGFRPAEKGFVRQDGVFVRFCKRASLDQDSTYVFIIDEINRSNLSKVFGELLMLIEADKRGSQNSLTLTYSASDEEQFYVPENIFVLGLMNTADRSLALVDYALRRRFSFFDLEPLFESEIFRAFLESRGTAPRLVESVTARMRDLNREIVEEHNLGRGFRIGHSYFCGQTGPLTLDLYVGAIHSEIVPLLQEYWFDDPKRVIEWTDKLCAGLS